MAHLIRETVDVNDLFDTLLQMCDGDVAHYEKSEYVRGAIEMLALTVIDHSSPDAEFVDDRRDAVLAAVRLHQQQAWAD